MTMPAADIFAAIGSASAPLTLARAADGFLPLLLADLARASDKRLVYVATDDTAMQAIADAAPFFAPDLIVHRFPAWRSEEHTSELQSIMRTSYDAFCLKKKTNTNTKLTRSFTVYNPNVANSRETTTRSNYNDREPLHKRKSVS